MDAEPLPLAPSAVAADGHPGARELPSQRDLGIGLRRRNEYLPTLFHRLMDDAPQQRREAPSAYAPTRRQIRDMVQRDLVYLLNTANQQDRINLRRHPEVVTATVNYGVPPLTGGYASEQRWAQVEQAIRIAILRFEPRIVPQSLQVRLLVHGDDRANYNVLVFGHNGSTVHCRVAPAGRRPEQDLARCKQAPSCVKHSLHPKPTDLLAPPTRSGMVYVRSPCMLGMSSTAARCCDIARTSARRAACRRSQA